MNNPPRVLLGVAPVILDENRDVGNAYLVPHIGLGYVASFLRSKNIPVDILDAEAEGLNQKEFERRVTDWKPDIFGFTASTYQINEAAWAAKKTKELLPDVAVVVGGYHAGAIPKDTLEQFPEFDFAVFLEGEETMYELAQNLAAGGNGAEVKGLAYRKDGNVYMNPARPAIKDLDALPYPAFDLFKLNRYKALYALTGWKTRELPVVTVRGCPYQCNFCYRPLGKQARYRTAGNVVQEILQNIQNFNINQSVFVDETFGLHRKKAEELCEEMILEKIPQKIGWICETRVDHMDRDFLALIKRAGCHTISYGVESGNQEILDKCKKGTKLEEIRSAVALTKEQGIRVYTNFIIGQAFETRETIEDSIRFALELDPDFASFSILTPFPGTEIPEMAEKGVGGLKLLSRDWRKYGKQVGKALELETVPRRELEKLQMKAYAKFYFKRKRFVNMFRAASVKGMLIYAVHILKEFLSPRLQEQSS